MCLAIPGQVVATNDGTGLERTGRVNFGGVIKEVSLGFVPEAEVGDFVVVHVGFAIARVDEAEAARVLRMLDELDREEATHDGEEPM